MKTLLLYSLLVCGFLSTYELGHSSEASKDRISNSGWVGFLNIPKPRKSESAVSLGKRDPRLWKKWRKAPFKHFKEASAKKNNSKGSSHKNYGEAVIINLVIKNSTDTGKRKTLRKTRTAWPVQ